LAAAEARFRLLAETVPSMVWTAAPDGTITWVNQRWLEYCGLTAQQNARGWPELVLHPDDYERCVARWAEHLREGKDYEIEVRNRRHDGVYRWFVTRAVPFRDPQGRITAWFGVTTDIHEQKELQRSLREADRRKDEFLAMLAHELRNPLAPVKNAMEMIRLRKVADPVVTQAREVVDRQVTHMSRLIDDLLDLSRIARGKVLLRQEHCDLVPIVRQTAEDYRATLEAGGLGLAVRLPPGPLWVVGDGTRLAQVVGNLLHNAGKFTDRGGQVGIEVTVEAGPGVAVAVRDTGVGMSPATLARVFETFAQDEAGRDRNRGGLGLGLGLVKGLTELHGGTVSAHSNGPGQGSTFIVRLPLAGEPSAAGPPS
jgi:PAS domain S-box-containing protein